jgi:hypothetical protein
MNMPGAQVVRLAYEILNLLGYAAACSLLFQ